MDKGRRLGGKLRLSLLFALVVFAIMLVTMGALFLVTLLLHHLGMFGMDGVQPRPLFIFVLVSLIVGTVLAVIFSTYPLRPLREIMDATDKIAAGDYSVRLEPKGMDEFRRLAVKFNHMAEELGSVEMLRSDFVNNFSHEFKTPIVSIRGFAKMLKWEELAQEEREDYLDIIIEESERLSELATNVLNLSKIEQQTILTDQKRFNVSEQIRLVIAMMDSKWTEKHIRFEVLCDEVYVTGNSELLQQVWINLLDNAIKFSPDGGKIAVQAERLDDRQVILICDQGEGISPEAAAHIFDKFYQGDPSHATKGNGLGLTLSKRIIDLHNGVLRIRQTGPTGTIFEVQLPASDAGEVF